MLVKVGQHPAVGYNNKTGKLVTAKKDSVGTVGKNIVMGDTNAEFVGGGGMGSAPHTDRYNPVRDRLDEGSVVEDWIPRDASGLDNMFRLMYNRDHIAGTVVDTIAELIWSDFELTGIEDPAIMRIYADTMEALNPISICPEITREYLITGKSISSLIWDDKRGIFRDIISHDPSFLRLTPIPIRGFDPKIDLIPSPALRQFVFSQDPRDVDARKILPEAYVNAIRVSQGGNNPFGYTSSASRYGGSGAIPLDPINTAYLCRKVFNYDTIGTSLFTRLITFWALEKALINSTVTSARRRSRSILHVTAGIDNMWEPSPEELDDIAGMFIQADEDPVGAVVTTRTGVNTSEVRAGADFYKWGDEWTMLNEGKMRALGANDALLSGDATYSNQDAARAFFMERAAQLRNLLTQKLFYNRIFSVLAQAHGFVKRSKAELDHRIIVKSDFMGLNRPEVQNTGYRYGSDNSITQRKSLGTPDSQLLVPTIKWNKDLVSSVNDQKMDMYDKIEERGIPVPLKFWAAAANIDVDSMMSEMDEDVHLRKRIAKWKQASEPSNVLDEAKLEFVKNLQNLSKANLNRVHGSLDHLGVASTYIFWRDDGTIGPLRASDLNTYLSKIDSSSNAVYATITYEGVRYALLREMQDPVKADIAHYILYRTGFTRAKPILSGEAIEALSEAVKSSLDRYAGQAGVYQLGQVATAELDLVIKLSRGHAETADQRFAETRAKLDNHFGKWAKHDTIADSAVELYSGK